MRFRLLPDDPKLAWTPFAYLVYLAFFLVQPVFAPQAPWERPATAAALAVFLPLYFWGYWLHGLRVLLPIAGIVTIGMVCAPWNVGASTFFIYSGAFAASAGPPTRAMKVLLLVLGALGLAAWQIQHSPMFWAPAAVFTPLVGGLVMHERALSVAGEKLRQSREEVSRLAQIAERERIARDLHDLLGHTLSLITIKAELAARVAERDPPRAAAEMRDVERISREATREVRHAVLGYRNRSLDDEVAQARTALDAAGVAFDCTLTPVTLEPLQEGVLSLALREAVTNVVRHARARSCRVTVDSDGGEVRLAVEDDGRGSRGPEGAGLTGMRERVSALGGRLERSAEHGTRLVVHLPRASAGALATAET